MCTLDHSKAKQNKVTAVSIELVNTVPWKSGTRIGEEGEQETRSLKGLESWLEKEQGE